MKITNKLFATLLTLVMVLSMSITAFAQGDSGTSSTTYTDVDSVTVQKTYTAPNGGTSPAETFTFEQTAKSVTDSEVSQSDIPNLPSISSAVYAVGEATKDGTGTGAKNITITLPTYSRVGVYTYTIAESAGSTAGVVYDQEPITLKVTVIQQGDELVRVVAVYKGDKKIGGEDGDGTPAFENTYNASTLKISKTVTGSLGDRNKYFEFTVTLNVPQGKTVNSTIGVGTTSNVDNPDSITIGVPATFYLHHGETLNLSNVPYGVTYTVTETQDSNYTTTVNDNSGNTLSNQTVDSAEKTVAFVNSREGEIDTGITTDSLPYLLIAAGVVAGGAVLVTRRRRFDD